MVSDAELLGIMADLESKPFDMQPCLGSTLNDLAMDLFLNTYRVEAITRDVLDENNRPVEEQMASLRLFDLSKKCPTHAAILLLAKDPLQWLSHAYIQFVHFPGIAMEDNPVADKRFSGDLLIAGRNGLRFSAHGYP